MKERENEREGREGETGGGGKKEKRVGRVPRLNHLSTEMMAAKAWAIEYEHKASRTGICPAIVE